MSLIGWWPFTTDGRNQGTLSTANASGYTLEENGKLGKCAYFNKSYYNSSINSTTNWNPWVTGTTIAGWVKVNYADYQAQVAGLTFSSSQSAATGNFFGSTSYGGTGIVWVSNTISSGGTINPLTSIKVFGYMRSGSSTKSTVSKQIPDNTWTHLALTADPLTKVLSFYMDGELVGNVSYSGLAEYTDTRSFVINRGEVYGGNGPGVTGQARYNDVRLYDHALTLGEIQELSRGLLVHYDFNYLDLEPNMVANPNSWSSTYTKPDGSGQNAIGTFTPQEDGSVKIVDNNTNTRIYWKTYPEAKLGDTFMVSIKQKLVSGPQSFRWQIQELNSSGSVVHTHWTHEIQEFSDLGEGWKLISFVCNVMNNNTVKLRFWIQDGADYTTYTHTYYLKDFSVQKVNSSTIIDGSGHGYNGITFNQCNYLLDTERGQYAFRTHSTANRTQGIGSASYIRSDIGTALTPTSFTISAWLKLHEWGVQTSGLMALGTVTDPTNYQDCTLSQRDSAFDINRAGSTTQYRLSSTFIPTGEWHHIAIVWNGSNAYGYLDGEQKATVAAAGVLDPFRYVFLGVDRAGGATRDADITWGEFKLYMSALSIDAIKDISTTKAYVFDDGSIMAPDLIETDNGLLVTEAGILQSNKFYESISDEYDHLEYIESSGTQYINTNFVPDQDTKIELDFQNLGSASLTNLFGVRTATAKNVFAMWINSTTVYPHYGNVNYTDNGSFTVDTTKRLCYKYNKNIASVDGDYITCRATKFNSQYALCLLAMNEASSIDSRKAIGRLFKCNIYNDGQLVRSFIPAKRRSDNTVGLYDAVNKQFYTNAGSGSFTAGPALSDRSAAFFESQNVAGRNIIEV